MSKKFFYSVLVGIMLSAIAFAALPNGAEAPAWSVSSWVCGTAVEMSACRGKNPVFILFWNSNLPGATALRAFGMAESTFRGKAQFIALTTDSREKVLALIGAAKPTFPIATVNADEPKKFFRPNDVAPVVIAIDKQGRIAWRGSAKSMASVAAKIVDGTFDIKENARCEKVAMEIGELLRKKEFAKVVTLLDQELERRPGSPDLIAMKCKLLAQKLDKKDEAMSCAMAATKIKDVTPSHFEIVVRLAHELKQRDKLMEIYKSFVARFPDKGSWMMIFCEFEMRLPPEQCSPEVCLYLATAAHNASGGSDKERGAIELGYARALNLCGRPDLAQQACVRASKLLTEPKDKEAAAIFAQYYLRVMKARSSLK